MSDCGHSCCPIRDNEYHRHTIKPVDCVRCNLVNTGEVFVWSDDPSDPCMLCVRWRQNEPINDDQSIAPRVWKEIHKECQEAQDVYPRVV